MSGFARSPGYRLLATVEDGKVRLLTRNGHDWAERMPAVRQTIGRLPVQAVMLDGELVRAEGRRGVELSRGSRPLSKRAVTTSCSSMFLIFSI